MVQFHAEPPAQHTMAGSVILDALRAGAAIVVLTSHWRNLFFLDYPRLVHPHVWVAILYFVTGLGRQAVMMFFVLSGYLVASSVERSYKRGSWSLGEYLNQRIVRLELVLIPALILCMICDSYGIHFAPFRGLYDGTLHTEALSAASLSRHGFPVLLGNIFFLQGISTTVYGTNDPLWSLSYEFFYYLFFPALMLVFLAQKKSVRIASALFLCGAMCFSGRTISCYFFIWLMGAVISILPKIKLFRTKRSQFLFFFLSLLALLPTLVVGRVHLLHGFAFDLLLGLNCMLVVYAATHCRFLVPHKSISTVAVWLAGWSYTLYLVHMPFLVLLASFSLHTIQWTPDAAHLSWGFCLLFLTCLYACLVAQITEKHTQQVRRWTSRRIVQPLQRLTHGNIVTVKTLPM